MQLDAEQTKALARALPPQARKLILAGLSREHLATARALVREGDALEMRWLQGRVQGLELVYEAFVGLWDEELPAADDRLALTVTDEERRQGQTAS